jgi:hypothetical protein
MEEAYENLTLRFDLYSQVGEQISEQYVIPPLDRIMPGGTLPLLASFSGDLDGTSLLEDYSAQFALLSAVAVEVDDPALSSGRYLEHAIQELRIQVGDDRLSAQVTGQAVVEPGTNSLWLVAVAFDIDQQPVGMRRLELREICPAQVENTPEAAGFTAVPTACGELPFELVVYSLGPAIERVELLTEAHR